MTAIETKTIQPRLAVQAMPSYHPPLASRDLLRLDFNENTFEPSPTVLATLRTITADQLTRYPEREPVERIVADHFALQPDQILLSNGVDEAIHTLCVTFLEQDDEALLWTPGFFMYDVSIGLMTSTGIRRVQSGPSLTFPFERFLAAITPRTKLIFLATPNNPTGATVPRAQLLAIAESAPHAILVVDEAYFHFHGETVLPDIASTPNLIVTRTFSKAYGLANLRIGMIAGPAPLIAHLRKASSPYNVNGIALACLPPALADEPYLDWYVTEVERNRTELMRGLDNLAVPYFPSAANFILMKIGVQHKALVIAARQRGILLRDRSADPGCEGYVRITIGPLDHAQRGLAALTQALQDINWTGYRAPS